MSAMTGYTRNLTEVLCGHPGHWQRGKHEGGRGSPSLFRPWWCYTLWMTPGHLHQVVDQAPPGCPPDRDGWYESHAGQEWERRISRQVIHGRPGCEDVRTRGSESRPEELVSSLSSRQTVLAAPPTWWLTERELPGWFGLDVERHKLQCP